MYLKKVCSRNNRTTNNQSNNVLPDTVFVLTAKRNTIHSVRLVTSHVLLVSSDVSGHVPSTVYKQHHHYNLNITTTFYYHSS